MDWQIDGIKRNLALVILWAPLLALLISLMPLIVLVYVIRTCEAVIFKHIYNADVITADEVIWTMKTPENPLLIVGMLWLDDELGVAECCTLLLDRLVNRVSSCDGQTRKMYPKASRFIQPGYIGYYWVDDPDFDISKHVSLMKETPVRSESELQSVISSVICRPIPGKSPWECLLLPYLEDRGGTDEGDNNLKTIMLFRLEHSIADGASLAYFLANFLGDTNKEAGMTERLVKKYAQRQTIFDTLRGVWGIPLVYLNNLTRKADDNLLHNPCITRQKAVAWSNRDRAISLQSVRAIKTRLNSTVNDVLTGCLSKLLRDFFDENGDCALTRRCTFINPVDTRKTLPREFNNKIAGLVFQLPTEQLDIMVSISEAKRRIDYMKRNNEALGIVLGWNLMAFLLPVCIAKPFVFREVNKTTGNLTNLIGPDQPIRIAGRTVKSITFWQPPPCCQTVTVSFLTYNGSLSVGVQSDKIALMEPERIIELFETNLRELEKRLVK